MTVIQINIVNETSKCTARWPLRHAALADNYRLYKVLMQFHIYVYIYRYLVTVRSFRICI